MNFGDRVAEAVERKQSCLCVGLDPRIDLLPPEVITGLHPGASGRARAYERFCAGVIDAVADEAVAVKPQVAFFEALGGVGISALERVCAHARDAGLLVIVDGKRGDIASTAEAYAQAWLHRRDNAPPAGDAVTLNAYMGGDSIAPFLATCGEGSGLFILTRTSNPGGADIQEAELEGGELVWERIASLVARWGEEHVGESGLSAVGAVVGATQPEAVARALLLPGIGAQGGRPDVLHAATSAHPGGGLIAPSRSVIYAWRDRGGDWRQGIRAAASELRRSALAV
jgi:orotidine-5'-phosphate decarboxylase